mmetsp:Transcript_1283/g.2989  ORF Transcript_1283/g.2989 Transcript_1283/m.2989 type:complete len:425 (+) Transcript_1283:241-1515(+)
MVGFATKELRLYLIAVSVLLSCVCASHVGASGDVVSHQTASGGASRSLLRATTTSSTAAAAGKKPLLSEATDPTWKQWEQYSEMGLKHPGFPEHFSDLKQAEVYKEWLPKVRSSPATCVVSMYSRDLLKPKMWGRYAAEINLNWALSQGHKYAIFRDRMANSTVSFGWSLPRAALFMLEQGEHECAYVFSIDGDAVVNNYKITVDTLTSTYLKAIDGAAVAPKILMACHWHHGKDGACNTCKCSTRASATKSCSEEVAMKEFVTNSHCGVNMGVYLLQNSAQTRMVMRWWAGAGAGKCDWQGDSKFEKKQNLAEQKCAVRMKAKWPQLVDVVHAGVINMPSWYDSRRRQMKLQVGDKNVKMDACFKSKTVFICHTMGLRDPSLRRRIFERELRQKHKSLVEWSAQHHEPYVTLTDLPADDSEWW